MTAPTRGGIHAGFKTMHRAEARGMGRGGHRAAAIMTVETGRDGVAVLAGGARRAGLASVRDHPRGIVGERAQLGAVGVAGLAGAGRGSRGPRHLLEVAGVAGLAEVGRGSERLAHRVAVGTHDSERSEGARVNVMVEGEGIRGTDLPGREIWGARLFRMGDEPRVREDQSEEGQRCCDGEPHEAPGGVGPGSAPPWVRASSVPVNSNPPRTQGDRRRSAPAASSASRETPERP